MAIGTLSTSRPQNCTQKDHVDLDHLIHEALKYCVPGLYIGTEARSPEAICEKMYHVDFVQYFTLVSIEKAFVPGDGFVFVQLLHRTLL